MDLVRYLGIMPPPSLLKFESPFLLRPQQRQALQSTPFGLISRLRFQISFWDTVSTLLLFQMSWFCWTFLACASTDHTAVFSIVSLFPTISSHKSTLSDKSFSLSRYHSFHLYIPQLSEFWYSPESKSFSTVPNKQHNFGSLSFRTTCFVHFGSYDVWISSISGTQHFSYRKGK